MLSGWMNYLTHFVPFETIEANRQVSRNDAFAFLSLELKSAQGRDLSVSECFEYLRIAGDMTPGGLEAFLASKKETVEQ